MDCSDLDYTGSTWAYTAAFPGFFGLARPGWDNRLEDFHEEGRVRAHMYATQQGPMGLIQFNSVVDMNCALSYLLMVYGCPMRCIRMTRDLVVFVLEGYNRDLTRNYDLYPNRFEAMVNWNQFTRFVQEPM